MMMNGSPSYKKWSLGKDRITFLLPDQKPGPFLNILFFNS